MSFKIAVLAALVAQLAAPVFAQTPAFRGALLIQPGENSAKCWVAGNGNANGSPIVLGDCTGAENQQFTFSGTGTLTAYGGSKCVDVVDGNTANGAVLQLWDCAGGNTNQLWWWTGDNHLSWMNHGKCVDLPGGSMANGLRIQLWDCAAGNPNQWWNVGYWADNLPNTSQDGQSGTNNCGTGSSQSAHCQTLWINSFDDFCVLGPPEVDTIGNSERIAVSWCTRGGHGSRVMPAGTLSSVHFVKTPDYVQITGTGDFTKINIPFEDEGGEMDNRGADGKGNPIGGLVYGNVFGNKLQFHEWTNFMSYNEYCIRACIGSDAGRNCNHIYDVMGCLWNMPASYDPGEFESCQGDTGEPMGVYGTSTWYQGLNPTPPAHSPPPSSNCVSTSTVGTGS